MTELTTTAALAFGFGGLNLVGLVWGAAHLAAAVKANTSAVAMLTDTVESLKSMLGAHETRLAVSEQRLESHNHEIDRLRTKTHDFANRLATLGDTG